jgi:hypothetical protein
VTPRASVSRLAVYGTFLTALGFTVIRYAVRQWKAVVARDVPRLFVPVSHDTDVVYHFETGETSMF